MCIRDSIYTRIPAHAAVAETVNAVKLLKGSSLRGLINGVLRNFQRSAEVILLRIDRVPSVRLGHPEWLTKRLRQALSLIHIFSPRCLRKK